MQHYHIKLSKIIFYRKCKHLILLSDILYNGDNDMKGLYSGRVILARKAAKGSLTRTQTAAQAYASIIKKYGSISDTAKYMHKGTGNWVKYSIENDRKRTGKVTTDIKKWRAVPHKLDFVGKDTKEAGTKAKRTFSVAALKAPTKPTGRWIKRVENKRHRVTLLHDDLINWHKPTKQEKPQKRKSNRQKTENKPEVHSDPYEIRVAKMELNTLEKQREKLQREWEESKTMEEYRGIARRERVASAFKRNDDAMRKCKDVLKSYNKNKFSISSLKQSGKPTGRKTKELPKVERTAITKTIPKKIQPNPVRTRYIYGSFQRPIWNGFDPGVKYKLLSNITNAYMDPRWNRKPHDVIITESPISAEKQYALQLTDIVQGKKMSAMIKRANAIKSLGDNMKGSLISQILKGVDPAVINKYIEKGKAAGKKEAKRVSRDKLSVAERAPEVKKPTGTRPAEFDLKSNSERTEFVSDYTGITDHLKAREKRVNALHEKQRKGTYKNADTRRHEANHAKYMRRKY